ncbi:sodium-coupled monocarboxylate transporter 1-like [Musca autumnalis]|uniref:sodium-coupled monocarboxylate transporter 1-like n=1 Tax=Musca autumnalis TaxID=221902 RepID=UPI003CEC6AEA
MSTILNSLASVCLEDYIKPFVKTPLSERQTAWIMRCTVVIICLLSVIMVLLIEVMGHAVLQLNTTLTSVTGGLSLFLMGLLMPWINSKSAITGCIVSSFTMTWIYVKSQIAMASGELVYPEKPFSTEGCTYEFRVNNDTGQCQPSKSFAQYIYQMSFFFYVAFGCFVSIVVAQLSTLVFGRDNLLTMNPQLFPPFVRKFIRTSQGENQEESLAMMSEGQTQIH